MKVCEIKFLVAYGEKSIKSMQIIQIFFPICYLLDLI